MSTDAGSTSLEVAAIDKIEAKEPIFAAHAIGDCVAFVLGEALLLASSDGEQRCEPHSGAILATCAGERVLLTGGDDGKVALTDASGASRVLAADPKRRWIDQVALDRDHVAWSCGRQLFLQDSLGRKYTTELPAAAAGLAFIAGSLRVVAAHNNGVTLWSPQESNPLETWNGPGGNASPLISPEGHLVATTLHEPGMRLWRLSDGAVMPLTGYTERVRSFAWTADGAYLLTSGAERVILWPAPEEGGRLYSVPVLVAPHRARSVAVAAHPTQPFIAAGYADGLVLLVRLTDAAELVIKRPDGVKISTVVWTAAGALVIASETGAARIITFGS